jgi:glycosyltransferase involved in cell wall biosynthesis
VKEVAAKRAGRLLDEAKTTVVYNGVDTDRFAPRSEPSDTTHRRGRFIALGRLDRRKGLDIALEALALVPEATLDIVGDGDERHALEELAARLGVRERVHFSGYAGDVRDAIATADIALSSARSEGLGVALIEAMAMGRPVVALPTGGIPEVVVEGKTGWLASANDARALASVMQAAIDQPAERTRRGAAARARVEQTFSLGAMRAGYEKVYQRLAPTTR